MTALLIARADPGEPEALALQAALSATLAALTGDGGQASFKADDVRGPRAAFALARTAAGQAVGCGALRPLQGHVAELKRMYAQPGTRGVGAALLAHLEGEARTLGYTALWLSTRRVNTRALAFYARHGYVTVPPWGHYAQRPASVCLGKTLGNPTHPNALTMG
ncbi:MAG: GNAT family N-acetyltransferase [Proteobacteria bacterium]|nr:GNAT family N-acetyltransferase [Pseudomonadota bacterium]